MVEPTRVVIYRRVSSDEQAKGYGLGDQRRDLLAFCERERLEVVGDYVDPGVSGTTELEERPGLSRALWEVREGRAEALVVARSDRLARATLQALLIEKAFLDAGGRVLYADGLNGDGDTYTLMRTVLHGFAEYDRRQLVRRLAEARRSKAATGGFSVGRVPFGYVSRAGKLQPAIGASDVVVGIFRDIAAGMTPGKVARALNEAGVPTQNGKRWSPQAIRVIIANEVYCGERHGVRKAHPPIVTRRLFNSAQRALAARARAAPEQRSLGDVD